MILSQSGYLIHVVDKTSDTKQQTVQIQISWLLQKPTDLDLHCLQRQGYPGSAGQGLKLVDNDKECLIKYINICFRGKIRKVSIPFG